MSFIASVQRDDWRAFLIGKPLSAIVNVATFMWLMSRMGLSAAGNTPLQAVGPFLVVLLIAIVLSEAMVILILGAIMLILSAGLKQSFRDDSTPHFVQLARQASKDRIAYLKKRRFHQVGLYARLAACLVAFITGPSLVPFCVALAGEAVDLPRLARLMKDQ